MYKQVILTHLLDYLKIKKIPYKKSGKIVMVECPFCHQDKMVANIIPNSYIINCFVCKKKYDLIDIAQKLEKNFPEKEEEQYHFLKELLKVKVMTKTDENNIKKILDFYVENGFDLVPIANNQKMPIEKDWTNKSHKEKIEWQNWIANGLNVGVKTGVKSNVTIIDIDQKPIPQEIKNLMGNTLIQESTNGFHLFYKYDKDFPKTRIDSLKIDIENDGGQVVIYPSKIKDKARVIQIAPIIEIPKEFKKFLLSKITIPRKTHSEEVREAIETEDFKIDPTKFALKNNKLEGSCNTEFIKLGGILRKQLNNNQTGYVLNVLNKHMLENPMQQKAINAMIRELDKYNIFDEKELAHRVLEYLKDVEEASRNEIAMTIVGTNRGEDKKRVDKALKYLVKEEYIVKKGTRYAVMQKANWSEDLIEEGKPINFAMPYFHDIANFNWGDLILIGSRNKKGKTHISMNIVKQLVEQGIKPYYISLETGSRFKKIAIQLGLKEGDFYHDFQIDPTKIELPKNAVTIIDWLLIVDKSKTDLVFRHLVEQLYKTNGIIICFQQLKQDNGYFAPNMAMQFPALSARYIYDSDDVGEYGKFDVDVIRDPKLQIKHYEIPCRYDWENKTLKKISENEIPKED